MSYDRPQIAGLLIDAQLALGARAVFENGVNVFDGAAASQIVDDIIDEFKEFERKFAHGNFGLFTEIDQLSFDAVAGGAPFIFFDQSTAVETITLISLVEGVQLHDNGLRERRDGYGLFDLGGHVKHAEFKSAKRGVRANVPPDFFPIIDAIQFHQKIYVVFVSAPGLELFRYAGAGETAKDCGAEGFQAGVAAHPER